MPPAHDAASLNEIAATSAIASRALVCEKLGRNDVDISCVHPYHLRLCIWRFLRSVAFVWNICDMPGTPGRWKEKVSAWLGRRCWFSHGSLPRWISVSLLTCICGVRMPLDTVYAYPTRGRTSAIQALDCRSLTFWLTRRSDVSAKSLACPTW